ncbi:MAG: hypothetical protein KAQ92_09070 [Candidatus Aenigmarchaeota archaeon]|nr:hypothetical protein [Candidatus Aenigmarchaeota archaeon]MCK5451765.1 hypothetical protein [Candidatus Omnitrophota bacterium]
MGKKVIVLVFACIFMTSLISAVPPITTIISENTNIQIIFPKFPVHEVNHSLHLDFWAHNGSNGVILENDSIYCTVNIIDDEGESIWRIESVSFRHPSDPLMCQSCFHTFVEEGNFSKIGNYGLNIRCSTLDNSTLGGASIYNFEVTYSGKQMSSSNAILYVPLYLMFFFIFIVIVYGIDRLPSANATDPDDMIIKISYLKYLRSVLFFVLWMLIVGILYISSNLSFAYLPDTLVANIFFKLYYICFGLTLPIITVWFIYIFAQIIDDRKMRALWERGMFQQKI